MAKKKRKKHRSPLAPKVHSAPSPQSPSRAGGGPPMQPPEAASAEASPESAFPSTQPVSTRRTKDIVRARQEARRRRSRRRTYIIVGGLVLLIAAAVIVQQVLGARSLAAFNDLAAANDCGELQTFGGLGSRHIAEGEVVDYDTSPPVGGDHSPAIVPAGVYEEPFSDNPFDDANIYRAVHSLEHGYIIVWHQELEDEERRAIESAYRGEHKVIVVPYSDLEPSTRVALTAWGHKLECEGPSGEVIDAFIDRLREAGSAPEPNAP